MNSTVLTEIELLVYLVLVVFDTLGVKLIQTKYSKYLCFYRDYYKFKITN